MMVAAIGELLVMLVTGRRVWAWSLMAALLLVVMTASTAESQDRGASTTTAPGVAKKPPEQPGMSVMELLLKGRWFMIPIGLCSLLGLGVIVERLMALRRGTILPDGFMAEMKAVFRHRDNDRQLGLRYCAENDCPLGRIMSAAIRKMPKGDEAVERAIEDTGGNEVAKLRRNLRMLYAVAAVSPMLGLLGTVWGMIQAFQVASKAGLGRAELLATGIYEALVTTFGGLVVAIPVLIVYYYLLSRIDQIVAEMNDLSVEFVDHYFEEADAEKPSKPF